MKPFNGEKQQFVVSLDKTAEVLIPDTNGTIEPVIIDRRVLLFLIKLLPKASMRDIVDKFAEALAINSQDMTMEDYIDALQEELNFHLSVNMIKEYVLPERKHVVA